MAVTTVLLMLANLCQLLLVCICVGGFAEVVHQWAVEEKRDLANRPRTAIGLPATLAVVIHAALLNMALLLISFPSFVAGELPKGVFFLSSLSFGGFAVCAIAAMSATRSGSKPLIGQLAISVVGLICVFAAYYQAGAS